MPHFRDMGNLMELPPIVLTTPSARGHRPPPCRMHPGFASGTRRGTVSGTAAAIALGPKVAGLVLTSSVTTRAYGAVPTQDIGSIQVPVLVVHHQRDACKVCVPEEARRMIGSFRSAPVRKFVMVDGGSDPEGDPCQARHWHGFINYEKEAVKLLTEWMLKPQG